jgi:imidazolonepropionase
MAVASDLNPGTSFCENLPLQMWLATTHYGMTVDEAWLGVTRHAARAAGRPEAGVLAPGRPADVVIWRADDHRAIPYIYGENLVARVLVAGQDVTVPPR